MAQFVEIPRDRLHPDVLQSLLEDYASRDGTDYGMVELSLKEKVGNLHRQLERGDLLVLFDADSEQWDITPKDEARQLLASR